MAITDDQGDIVQRYSYEAFGQLTATNPSFDNFYTYTGREYDKETGLYYYRARYYDAMEGRFISKDPIGLLGGINQYAYTFNNPTNFIDPSGLDGIAIDFGGGYATGTGGNTSEGGSAGSGFYVGTKPNSNGYAQLGAYSYQSWTDDVTGARLGLGANLTWYKTDSRDFFKGDMNYSMLTLFIGSLIKYTDPCTGEVTGWSLSLAGKGLGLTGFETGVSRSWSTALQE